MASTRERFAGMARRLNGTSVAMVTNGAVLLLGLGTSVVSARSLGPEGRGEYFALQAVAAVVALMGSFGLPQAIVTLGGSSRHGTRLLIACHTLVVAAVFLGVYGLLAHALGTTFLGGWLAPMGGAAFAAASAASGDLTASAQLRGQMLIRFNAVRLFPLLAGFATCLLLAVSSNRRASDWLILIGAAQLVAVIPTLATEPDRGRPDRQQVRRLARECARVYPAALLSQVTYKLDVLLVSLLLPSASVGYYSVASAAGSSVASLGNAYGMMLFSDGHWSRQATLRRASKAVGGTAAIAVPAAIVAPWVVETIYGSAFSGASTAAQILILAAVPQAADYLLIHAHLLSGRLRRMYYVQGATAAVTVLGLLGAIAGERLAAIALVSPISYAISAVLLAIALHEHDVASPHVGVVEEEHD